MENGFGSHGLYVWASGVIAMGAKASSRCSSATLMASYDIQ